MGRFIQILGSEQYPVPNKKRKIKTTNLLTTIQILLKIVSEYPLYTPFLYDAVNGIIWTEAYTEDNECKAIILADESGLIFKVKTSILNEISSIVTPTLSDTDAIENYLNSIRIIDEYEYFYPDETLSLIGTNLLQLPIPYGRNKWPNSILVYDSVNKYLYFLDGTTKHYVFPVEDDKVFTVEATVDPDNRLIITQGIQLTIDLLAEIDPDLLINASDKNLFISSSEFTKLVSGIIVDLVI